jgi:hypothetical protein
VPVWVVFIFQNVKEAVVSALDAVAAFTVAIPITVSLAALSFGV